MSQAISECSTVIVGRGVSANGQIIVAHNEDDHGRALVEQHWVPSFRYGGSRRFEPWLPEIERAPRTHAFYWSQTLIRGGASFSNLVMNERGVLVVSNACNGLFEDSPGGEAGALGFGFRVELVERASTAREAVKTAVKLLKRYGYSGSGRTYTIADAKEAWLFAVIQGRGWAARRVRDDEVAYVPNCFTLTDLDLGDRENVIVSPELIEKCAAAGRCRAGDRIFRFREAVQPAERRAEPFNFERTKIGWKALCGIDITDPEEAPCCVRMEKKIDVEDIKALLRLPGPGDGEPCNWLHGHGYGISRPGTHDATIIRMSVHPLLSEGWKAVARPDETIFIPFFPLARPAGPAASRDWKTAFRDHFTAGPEYFSTDIRMAFWDFTLLANAAEVLPKVWGRQHAVFRRMEKRFDSRAAVWRREAGDVLRVNPDLAVEIMSHCNDHLFRMALGSARRMLRPAMRRIRIDISSREISASGEDTVEVYLFSGRGFDAGRVDVSKVYAGPMRGSVPDDRNMADLAVPVSTDVICPGFRPVQVFTFKQADLARWLQPGGVYDLWLYTWAEGKPVAAVTLVKVTE